MAGNDSEDKSSTLRIQTRFPEDSPIVAMMEVSGRLSGQNLSAVARDWLIAYAASDECAKKVRNIKKSLSTLDEVDRDFEDSGNMKLDLDPDPGE